MGGEAAQQMSPEEVAHHEVERDLAIGLAEWRFRLFPQFVPVHAKKDGDNLYTIDVSGTTYNGKKTVYTFATPLEKAQSARVESTNAPNLAFYKLRDEPHAVAFWLAALEVFSYVVREPHHLNVIVNPGLPGIATVPMCLYCLIDDIVKGYDDHTELDQADQDLRTSGVTDESIFPFEAS